ncbi:MAG: heat-inducible transcription repressor HrcA [Nitrospirae bacterium GWD2_57_9]|nr:MAG: heat-inducible transcription repressor HrcA [Nitrospirae bacterium GWD2_57_9]OGW48750.1 MAG: heat-inducible transcription repressor HrcA [Nitrospirae bacterium GWC2_57_9]
MELDERNKRVLQAVIDSYIANGSPIGSNVLIKRYDFGVSSATVRNIMAELEEMGYLTHPHTSAGRIPTDLGYRYYIDSLISIENDSDDLEDQLRQVSDAPGLQGEDLEGLMQEASRFLATLSHCAGVVISPVEPEGRYKHIEFVRLRGRQVLLIFVTSTGMVQNKLIDLDESITQHDLNYFSAYLDEELEHWTLADIRQRLLDKLQEEKLLFGRLMEETYRASQEVHERDAEKVYIGGASQVMESPEFANVEKMRTLFKAFEDKYKLLKVLDRSVAADGIKVFIGSENPLYEMQGCSMVVGSYRAGTNIIGTLGVIGPTRMQYKQVIHVVDYTARLLSRLLGERYQRGLDR